VNLDSYLSRRRQQVDRALARHLPHTIAPDRLAQAMRYSLFSEGKRIRPILALAASEAIRAPIAPVLPFACAIELIHTYSLIHDDLPAMDDDDLRRGKPTNHRVFGEGLAILAGDALLTEAFRIMGEAAARSSNRKRPGLQVLTEVAAASGAHGMVGGQVADLEAERQNIDLPTVEFIHVRKTGALIRASVRAGALMGNATPRTLQRLTRYAECLGLAFQVADDLLDAEGSTKVTGKVTGRDRALHKATFPAVLGLSASRERACDLLAGALEELTPLGSAAEPLRAIARFVVDRALGASRKR
jgi:geranylgeranyl diphosphate synthase type II